MIDIVTNIETELHARPYKHSDYGGLTYHRLNWTDFYFRPGSTNNLIVFFHGALPRPADRTIQLPVFRAYNYKPDSAPHILCISDAVTHYYYADVRLAWYLDTKNIKQVATILEIVDFFKTKLAINNILFCGSSGGGYPAIRFAALTQQSALLSNSQIFLDRDFYYEKLIPKMEELDDEFEEHDLRKILAHCKGPFKIFNNCNLKDSTTIEHHKHFFSWANRAWPGTIESRYFAGYDSRWPHLVQWPGINDFLTEINAALTELGGQDAKNTAKARNVQDDLKKCRNRLQNDLLDLFQRQIHTNTTLDAKTKGMGVNFDSLQKLIERWKRLEATQDRQIGLQQDFIDYQKMAMERRKNKTGLSQTIAVKAFGQLKGRAFKKRISNDIKILSKSKLFDPNFYLSKYPDIAAGGLSPVEHYVRFGWIEFRDPNEFFDTYYYLFNNNDVLHAMVNPLVHFLTHGWKEFRNPCPAFNVKRYLENNPDVAEAGMNPLAHYITHGRAEWRLTKA